MKNRQRKKSRQDQEIEKAIEKCSSETNIYLDNFFKEEIQWLVSPQNEPSMPALCENWKKMHISYIYFWGVEREGLAPCIIFTLYILSTFLYSEPVVTTPANLTPTPQRTFKFHSEPVATIPTRPKKPVTIAPVKPKLLPLKKSKREQKLTEMLEAANFKMRDQLKAFKIPKKNNANTNDKKSLLNKLKRKLTDKLNYKLKRKSSLKFFSLIQTLY